MTHETALELGPEIDILCLSKVSSIPQNLLRLVLRKSESATRSVRAERRGLRIDTTENPMPCAVLKVVSVFQVSLIQAIRHAPTLAVEQCVLSLQQVPLWNLEGIRNLLLRCILRINTNRRRGTGRKSEHRNFVLVPPKIFAFPKTRERSYTSTRSPCH